MELYRVEQGWNITGAFRSKYDKIGQIGPNTINFSGTGWNKVGLALRTFRLTSLANLPDLECPKYDQKWAEKWPI